jgi:hypothetical protein
MYHELRKRGTRLAEEEAPHGIGHTIRDHVGKNDEELLQTLRERQFGFPTLSLVGKRQGSFDSLESANDFVNRTLERNRGAVDLVATGKSNEEFITQRFGRMTGREAYRPSPNSEPYIRNTYSVGVLSVHDLRSPRGYRVFTAYPRND